jgi:predicted XRE-type DNA-binding protein
LHRAEPKNEKDMNIEYYQSVWDVIEDTAEASLKMRLRSDLMAKIAGRIREWGVTQKEAAHRLGINQPRLKDLLDGRISKFNLDELVNLTARAHIHLELSIEGEKEAVWRI